jgi:CHAT domain-containing protein
VAVFTDTLEARRVTATPIAPDPDAILDALAQPDFDVLHVCCHGQAQHDDIEQSALIVGDRLGPGGAPEPVLLDALTVREEARLGGRGPLVFLNACESGRMGASLTAWGGWPKTFWDAGAAAFVGTSWPVEDAAARAFCEAFYGGLLDGKTLAEAAGSGRRAARQLHEPTSLAYKVYGLPAARRG